MHNLLQNVVVPLVLSSLLVSHKYDPDQDRTTCEIVSIRGFPCEIHPVVTHGGYIVELHRIPRPGGKPVMLIAGLVGNSAEFVMASDKVDPSPKVIGRNMAFELYKQGYDVWMTNNRGSRYGLRHLWLDPKGERFWHFTFDEISDQDVPAYIQYVRRYSGFSRVHVIGHSQGSAVMLALLSRTTGFNQVVHTFTAICPVTRIKNAKTTFRYVVALFKSRFEKASPAFTRQLPISKNRFGLACELPVSRTICILLYSSFIGPNIKQLDVGRLGVYTSQVPTTTSNRNVMHFHQLFNSNRFQKYDHGDRVNLALYGTTYPPEYDIRSISHPNVYVIYAKNDWYVPMDGIAMLKRDLKAREFYEISDPKANHMDPLIGLDIAREVNWKVISTLARYSRL